MLSEKDIEFIIGNRNADTSKLLLGASKYPEVNVKLCVNCIESRQKIASKLPMWYANPELAYPFPLSAEQCSSEATGEYKRQIAFQLLQRLHTGCSNLEEAHLNGADLTGGMGVDTYYLSQLFGSFHYFERNSELCMATRYNFQKLEAEKIELHNLEINGNNISQLPGAPFDFIFIDPARRSRSDKSSKVISLQEYEPNIVELKDELFKVAPIVLVKVSPMADIKLNLSLLPQTSQIHIVSVDNECKELLFVLQSGSTQSYDSVGITTVNLSSKGREPQFFRYTLGEEECAQSIFASKTGKYLYEPNKSLLKGGAFKLPCSKFGVTKLATSTHLYTSDDPVMEFPGKIFEIQEVVEFNKKNMKKLASEYPHADISARNFPLDTNALKKMSGIKDGGERHLFATTLNNGEKVVIIASVRR